MSVPASKEELLAAISTSFDKLIRDLDRVPSNLVFGASMKGHAAGRMMSPADLVAYLIGCNELALSWLEQDDRGEAVNFPETGFKWNQLGSLADKFYADYETLDWPERLAHLKNAQARLMATVAGRSDVELYGAPWYGKWTKGRMIQLNTSSPYANARDRIRSWLKSAALN